MSEHELLNIFGGNPKAMEALSLVAKCYGLPVGVLRPDDTFSERGALTFGGQTPHAVNVFAALLQFPAKYETMCVLPGIDFRRDGRIQGGASDRSVR